MQKENGSETDQVLVCPKCGHDEFTVLMLEYIPKVSITRNSEGDVEFGNFDRNFNGRSEFHGDTPYWCDKCDGQFAEDDLVVA